MTGLLLQMDLATKNLKTNNMKLKGLVTQVPPSLADSGEFAPTASMTTVVCLVHS